MFPATYYPEPIDTFLSAKNQMEAAYDDAAYNEDDAYSHASYKQRTSDPVYIPKVRFGNLVVTIKEDGAEPSFEGISSTKEDSIMEYIEQKIFKKLVFPVSWEKDGISKPNLAAKDNAFNICRKLFESDNLIPDKILASKEEGIFISYDFADDDFNRSLIIETYNNVETAAIVCDNLKKEIVLSEDIYGLSFSNVIRIFKEANC